MFRISVFCFIALWQHAISDITWIRKKENESCHFRLSPADGEIYKYTYYDKKGDEITPSLVSPNLLSIPNQSQIRMKCKQRLHLTLYGEESFSISCTGGQLKIPVDGDCYVKPIQHVEIKIVRERRVTFEEQAKRFADCSINNCQTTCKIPIKNGTNQNYIISHSKITNVTNKAWIKSEIHIQCKKGFSTLNGRKSSSSVCELNNGWTPPLEFCFNEKMDNREKRKTCSLPIIAISQRRKELGPFFYLEAQTYTAYDVDGNEIETLSTENVPINTTLVVTCKEGYFMTNGVATEHVSVCQDTLPYGKPDAQTVWMPPIELCYPLGRLQVTKSQQNTWHPQCYVPVKGLKTEDEKVWFEYIKYSKEIKDFTIYHANHSRYEGLMGDSFNNGAPLNTTIVYKCHDMHLLADGTNTFTSTCHNGVLDGVWQPPLSRCFNCTHSKCRTTCQVPKSGGDYTYQVYKNGHATAVFMNLTTVPLSSTINVTCNKGFMREDGRKSVISTCQLNVDGNDEIKSEWDPPLETCYRSDDMNNRSQRPPNIHKTKKIVPGCKFPMGTLRYDPMEQAYTPDEQNQLYEVYDRNNEKINSRYISKVSTLSKVHVKCNFKIRYKGAFTIHDDTYIYKHTSNNTYTSICSPEGQFVPALNQSCYKTCPKIRPSLFKFTHCSNSLGKEVDCEGALFVGTKALSECRSGYHIDGMKGPIAYCNNGGWDNLPNCVPDCGQLAEERASKEWKGDSDYWLSESYYFPPPGFRQEGVGGTPATPGNFGWHIAIYRAKQKKEPSLVCGGTIISSKMIITAAHCFYDQNKEELVRIPTDYEIVVAKSHIDYSIVDERYTKNYKLKKILYPDAKFNSSANFGADIAILITKRRMEFHKDHVYPACLDWFQKKLEYSEDELGEVYGWGINENGTLSDNLYYFPLPYIPYNECLQKVQRYHVTPDKFCAGNIQGTGLRKGDSGGGYLSYYQPFFNEQGYKYVTGITSTRDNGDVFEPSTTSITAFTDVLFYMPWIKRIFDQEELQDDDNSENGDEDDDDLYHPPTSEKTQYPSEPDSLANSDCKIPQTFDLKYTLVACNSTSSNSLPVCKRKLDGLEDITTWLEYNCTNSGGTVETRTHYCADGSWTPPLESCQVLTSVKIELEKLKVTPSNIDNSSNIPSKCIYPSNTATQTFVLPTCESASDDDFCKQRPGDMVDPDSILEVRCSGKGVVAETSYVSCIGGEWQPPITPCKSSPVQTLAASNKPTRIVTIPQKIGPHNNTTKRACRLPDTSAAFEYFIGPCTVGPDWMITVWRKPGEFVDAETVICILCAGGRATMKASQSMCVDGQWTRAARPTCQN